jgi:hypothetical protein
VAKKISVQYDHRKIPVLGLVPESASSAPSSPVNGQLWYDTSVNRFKVYENGSWVLSSLTGAELLTNKGVANGYASLGAGGTVPIAQIPLGSTASTVTVGNDARLSDQRVPTDASVTGGTAGAGVKIAAATITAANIASATITDVQIAAANKDGAAGVASLRTLGTGAAQAAAGNDSRLSDQRVPTDGSVTGGPAGAGVKIAAATITDVNIAAANKDGIAGLASLRTLGNGATQAMPGNYRLDQVAVPTASVNMNGQILTGLGAPVQTSDAVRLADLQAAQAGIDNKPSVRLVATGNLGLSGLAAIDGVTPIAGDRVLAVGQTTASQNGPYVAAAGAWSRATDTVSSEAFWMVEEGTTYGASQWKVSTPNPITLGTTSLAINQWGAAGTTYTGTTNRVTVSGATIDIAATYAGQTSITTLGTIATGTWNGTTIAIANGGTGATTAAAARANLGTLGKYAADMVALTAGVEVTVTHNLNTTDILPPAFKETTGGALVELGVRVIDANSIGVTSDFAYSAAALRVTVAG